MLSAPTLLRPPRPTRVETPVTREEPCGPPPRVGLAKELLGAREPLRLIGAAPWLLTAPRGDGRVVIDLPGWRTPELSNSPLRAYLRLLGWSARGWGLGVNRGDPETDAERLAERVAAEPEPVALVGWSLGGVVAREVARVLPEHVSQVITFGSPIVGGPTHTIAAAAYGEAECRRVTQLAAELDETNPIQVPITAIFTRRDSVVDWRACIDHRSPNVRHVESKATHLSLGLDPDVWWTVATALAGSR